MVAATIVASNGTDSAGVFFSNRTAPVKSTCFAVTLLSVGKSCKLSSLINGNSLRLKVAGKSIRSAPVVYSCSVLFPVSTTVFGCLFYSKKQTIYQEQVVFDELSQCINRYNANCQCLFFPCSLYSEFRSCRKSDLLVLFTCLNILHMVGRYVSCTLLKHVSFVLQSGLWNVALCLAPSTPSSAPKRTAIALIPSLNSSRFLVGRFHRR